MSKVVAAKKSCAYCGAADNLTNEHIWPKCLLDREGNLAKYLGKNAKFVRGDLKIGDVCGACNHGPLSKLDAYACELYDEYFHNLEHPGKGRIFEYSYEKLLRWLLKVSYNAARTRDSEAAVLRSHADYILNGGDPPETVSLRADLVKPAWHRESASMIPAQGYRAAQVFFDQKAAPGLTIRLVSVNAYYFYILIFAELEADRSTLQAVLHAVPETQLSAEQTEVEIQPSGMNIFHAMKDWVANPLASASFRAMKEREQ